VFVVGAVQVASRIPAEAGDVVAIRTLLRRRT
jgi:hypothetical protein